MVELNIGATTKTDLGSRLKEFFLGFSSILGPRGHKETEFMDPNWSTYLTYFREIPELKAAINTIARWSVGKGFKADEQTTMILNGIRGNGKQTFNSIIENLIRTYHVADIGAFAEIIEDDDGNLINLKPLDPGLIKIIYDEKGMIKRYEQVERIEKKKTIQKFKPENILHLCKDQIADEMHGTGIVGALLKIINWRNQAMEDKAKVLHRNVHPVNVFVVDSDKPSKLKAFQKEADDAMANRENLVVPKGTVEFQKIATPQFSSMDPQSWIEALNEYFFEACNVPRVIVGNGKTFTESNSKIAYLAFQQIIEEEQLFLEEQLLAQLNIVVEFEFPASLENELLSDKKKDKGDMQFQPNETTASMEGKT